MTAEAVVQKKIFRNRRVRGLQPQMGQVSDSAAIVFLQPASGYTPPADPRQSGLDHYSLEIEQTPGGPDAFAAWLREQGVPIDEGPVKRNGAHGVPPGFKPVVGMTPRTEL